MNEKYTTVNCPYCVERGKAPDTKKHLYVYAEGRGVHCFRCDFHRTKAVPEEVSSLLENVDYITEATFEGRPDWHVRNNPEWHLRFARPVSEYRRAMAFLKTRGVTNDEAESLRLLYTSKGDFQGRVIFPVRESTDGPIRYFVGRSIHDERKPKYRNCPTPKNGHLYIVGDGKRAIVTEGPFDAIGAAKAGYLGIALLGKTCSVAQARRIGAIAGEITIILDPDAFHKSIEISLLLSFYVPTARKDLPRGADLGDLTTEMIRGIMGSRSILEQIEGEASDERIYRGPT